MGDGFGSLSLRIYKVDGYFGPNAAVKPMPNQLLRRASEWLRKEVRDRNGKEVGEVEDLV